MAPRKAIVRIGPQPTSFEQSLFGTGFGGYNWQLDQTRGLYTRKPGSYPVAPTINDPARLGLAPASFGDLNRQGIVGIAPFVREPLLTPFDLGIVPETYLRAATKEPSSGEIWLGCRSTHDLLALGMFPWLVAPLRVARVLVNCSITVSDIAGVKTVSLATTDGATSVSVAATSTVTALLASAPTILAGTASVSFPDSIEGWGNFALTIDSLPYGSTLYKTGDVLEIAQVFPLPTTDFYASNNNYSSVALSARVTHDPSVFTFAQIGNALYVAGAGIPLMRYDGSRVYAAGASPLTRAVPATSSLGGTGLTGVYRYRVMHRVYSPDGTFVEGEPYDLGVVNPANQTVTWTFSRANTVNNMRAGSAGSAQVGADGVSYLLQPMYKCTDFTLFSRSVTPTPYYDLRVATSPGLAVKAQVWPGDPLITWNAAGSTLEKCTVESVYPDGQFTITGTPILGSTPLLTTYISAGDVYVLQRTVAGGSIYYEVAEIPTGTPSYADHMSDATLITKPQYLELTYTKSPPPASTVAVCAHQTRIVVAHKVSGDLSEGSSPATELSWSEPGTEHFPPENSISFVGTGCSRITGLASNDDILYILTDTGVYYIQGTLSSSPATYTLQTLEGAPACSSPASVVVVGNTVMWVTPDLNIAQMQAPTVRVLRDLLPVEGYSTATARTVHDFRTQRTYFFLSPLGNTKRTITAYNTPLIAPQSFRSLEVEYGTEGLCLVLDEATGKAFRYTNVPATGGAAYYNSQVLFADLDVSSMSTIRGFDELCPSDDGEDIRVEIVSPFEDGTTPHLQKTFQRLTVFAPNAESQFTLGVRVEKDWDERYYIQDFEQEFRTGEGYAEEPYATDPYGDGVIPDRSQDLEPVNAKSLRVTLTHEDKTEVPVINGWVLEYSDTTNEGREE